MHKVFPNKVGALAVLLIDALAKALADYSPSAASLLLTLHYRGSMTATELAVVVGISQPTAVRVTDRLVRLGLIQRQAHAGRTTPLRLTRAGERRAAGLQRDRLKAMRRLVNVLDGTERKHFEHAVNKILRDATLSRAFARTTCRLCDHSVCVGQLCPVGSKASALSRQNEIAKIRGRNDYRTRG